MEIEIQNIIKRNSLYSYDTLNDRTISDKGSLNEFKIEDLVVKEYKAEAGQKDILDSLDSNLPLLTFIHIGLYDTEEKNVNLNDKRISFNLGGVTFEGASLTVSNIKSFTDSLSVTIPTIADEREMKLIVFLGYKNS